MDSWPELLEQYRLADLEYSESVRVITNKLDKFADGLSNDLPSREDFERSEKALKARMEIDKKMSAENLEF